MKQFAEDSKTIKWLVTIGDMGVMLLSAIVVLLFGEYYRHGFSPYIPSNHLIVLLICSFFPSFSLFGTIVHKRTVRIDMITLRAIYGVLCHACIFYTLMAMLNMPTDPRRFYAIFYILFFISLVTWRLLARSVIKKYRSKGGNMRSIILVGYSENIKELLTKMDSDLSIGCKVYGVFNDEKPTDIAPERYFGNVDDIIPWLKEHKVNDVFCCLPSARAREITAIIDYCENNVIRFYSVPNVRNYLKRKMEMELFGEIPVLCIREEPLTRLENRVIKRTMDIIISLFVLCTIFPILYIIVGSIIKITSRGPVFFKQKRSGINDEPFYCLKFRSMRVNPESDDLQATKNDSRKTKFGEFLRKSSLDEFPQFINVLKGEMSIVGPRPHMLKHTEEYSRLVNKYMVRHFVKPGITGMAQVSGFRGETQEVSQMEGRIHWDIWYIEHWSIVLDIQIMFKTIKNAICGDSQAY